MRKAETAAIVATTRRVAPPDMSAPASLGSSDGRATALTVKTAATMHRLGADEHGIEAGASCARVPPRKAEPRHDRRGTQRQQDEPEGSDRHYFLSSPSAPSTVVCSR